MKQHGIQVHSQLRAGGIAVNSRPAQAATDSVSAADSCAQGFAACRTNKMKSGISPGMANTFCKAQLKQCTARVA